MSNLSGRVPHFIHNLGKLLRWAFIISVYSFVIEPPGKSVKDRIYERDGIRKIILPLNPLLDSLRLHLVCGLFELRLDRYHEFSELRLDLPADHL